MPSLAIDPRAKLFTMPGAIVGSYFSARFAKRIDPRLVRNGILVWAIILTAFAFWKYY